MTRYIGAHLSVAKGLSQAVQNMLDRGGNALQIFSGSPRGWARRPLETVNVDDFLTFRKEKKFGPVFIHALYLINLVGGNEALVKHSVDALIYDLKFVSKIQASGVIVHLGSHLGNGYDSVFDQLVARIGEILDKTPQDSVLLVENSAGQQGKLCSTFEDLQRLFVACEKYVKTGRLGLCLDTCHAFSAGYHLTELAPKLKQFSLLDNLKVIHLNDSRDPFASGRDRHENIGKGSIGEQELKTFLNDTQLEKYPLILEVPGLDGMGPDSANVKTVRELIQ